MNRRGFLKFAGAVVGGIAVEQAIPLGRVWSFPSRITIHPAQRKFLYNLCGVEKSMTFYEFYDLQGPAHSIFPADERNRVMLMRQWRPLRPLEPEAAPRSFEYPIIGNIAWHKNRRSA